MRVIGAVPVLVTDRRVERPTVTVVGAVVGVGVAVATAAGWSGAFAACRFSLANIVMPPKLVSVIAEASTRRTSVEPMSGLVVWRDRVVMFIGEHPALDGA